MPEKRLVQDQVPAFDGWNPVSAFTALPVSTSSLTMTLDLSATLRVNMPLRYQVSGVYRYGIVNSCSPTLLQIKGAPFDMGIPVTELSYGTAEKIVAIDLGIAGTFADALSNTVLASKTHHLIRWLHPRGRLVCFSGYAETYAGPSPSVNIRHRASNVSTMNANNGISITSGAAWFDNSAVAVSLSQYAIEPYDSLEVSVTVIGGPTNLSLGLVYVLE
jgi:hypothetical protein